MDFSNHSTVILSISVWESGKNRRIKWFWKCEMEEREFSLWGHKGCPNVSFHIQRKYQQACAIFAAVKE